MKSAIIVFPGTNRERDMGLALAGAAGRQPALVWHANHEIPPVDLIVIPGGFAFGDYLRPGAMAARSPAIRTVVERARAGVAVLGVCNGFQVLTEIGLLPGALMRNARLKFICREQAVRVETTQSLFTSRYRSGQSLSLPLANNDGSFFADEATLDELEKEDRVVFRYVDDDGRPGPAGNPNGSVRSIAGILNRERTVLGLMPHPENAIDPAVGGTDGRPLFDALVESLS